MRLFGRVDPRYRRGQHRPPVFSGAHHEAGRTGAASRFLALEPAIAPAQRRADRSPRTTHQYKGISDTPSRLLTGKQRRSGCDTLVR
jgi:hypothetical protein